MSAHAPAFAPAWQTEELQDEWVELEEDDNDNITYGTRSISLTAPLATLIHTNGNIEDENHSFRNTLLSKPGTFVVRESMPSAPLLPKTPGRDKKGGIKDFFSQTPLERMFDPPSPPKITSSHATVPTASQSLNDPPDLNSKGDEIVETDMPDIKSFHGRKANIACQFTFSMPQGQPSHLNTGSNRCPQAQSTPNPPLASNGTTAPTTDPRLRLFQFQYDTYTREQLSAMVDSIAINSGTPSTTSFHNGLSRVSEVTGSVENMSHLRSTKRVKLSPRTDFCEDAGGERVNVTQPQVLGKDYVGESRSLMQQIRQARDFSTISTTASGGHPVPKEEDSNSHGLSRRGSLLLVPEAKKDSSNTDNSSYPSATYRQQAVALMAQIKNDMKGQKRLFSGDTEASYVTSHVDDKFPSHSSSIQEPVPSHSLENKENQHESTHRRTGSLKSVKSASSKGKRSPQKPSQDYIDADNLAKDVSKLSLHRKHHPDPSIYASQLPSTRRVSRSRNVNAPVSNVPSLLAPSSYPSESLRTEDLNRFVSSSTASGTTLTAGSAPSYVKHPGPAHIRTIAPTDVPEIPDQLGDMLFDKVMMKWVKNTMQATNGDPIPPEEISEDPFQDIESLRDDLKDKEPEHEVLEQPQHHLNDLNEMTRIEEEPSMTEEEEEMDLTSFSTDDPSALVVDVMTGVGTFDDYITTDSDDEDDDEGPSGPATILLEYDSDDAGQSESASSSVSEAQPSLVPGEMMQTSLHRTFQSTVDTPVVRSAMKSHSGTPTSAMKDPNRSRFRTPMYKSHARSVSFSDGRKEGPIHGLGNSAAEASGEENMGSGIRVVYSARSRRIAQMIDALQNDDEVDGSPTNLGLLQVQAASPRGASPGRRVFTRSRRTSFTAESQNNINNATFLTECSFTVSHDRLVEVITDVEPFTPHWEGLRSIDLSEKKLESVARLKEFLPQLDMLNLNCNQLSWLSGVPGSVRTLSIASNSLTGLTSFAHLHHLEYLDISRNDIESLTQLSCLRHLRELKADGNKITSTEGLERMDGLVKLSLQGNSIGRVDFSPYEWTRLEMLNMSHNQLDRVLGLGSLQALVVLNLDNNELSKLEVEERMPKLRMLRLSGNKLGQLEVGAMNQLRTLYADNNRLTSVDQLERLTKLENLSLRNQSGRNSMNLLTRDVRDIKRLYLSGNPLKTGFLNERCYNLIYLEVAACRLGCLPAGLGQLAPNLRVLNLNYNFIEDVGALCGLTRLKKLTMIGSRLKLSTKGVIRLVEKMGDLEMLDLRMNPFTLGWYLPLLVKDVKGALEPGRSSVAVGGGGGGGREWQELDSKFRRDLPDSLYVGRLAYRGLVMRECVRMRMLDGVMVTGKERRKACQLLTGIEMIEE